MTTEQIPIQVAPEAPGTGAASEPGLKPARWGRPRMTKFAINTALGVLGLVFLLPIIWLVDAALNPKASQALVAPAWSLSNFHAALVAGAGGAIKNSLYLAVLSTVVATAVSTLAAYALSRRRVPFKGSILLIVLFLTGLPVTLLLIPIYQNLCPSQLGQLAVLHFAGPVGHFDPLRHLAVEELH